MKSPTAAGRNEQLLSRAWLERYTEVRDFTRALCETLEPEDCVVQTMPDVSPTRWHLAHTTWFFETFVLRKFVPDFVPYDETYETLFNSYYNAVGPQFPRARRGLLSRPTLAEVWQYRRAVDEQVLGLLDEAADEHREEIGRIVEIGLHHEQQHQELILTDIKHVLSRNPSYPVFLAPAGRRATPGASGGDGNAAADSNGRSKRSSPGWCTYEEGLVWIGHDGEGFAFDNEGPRHRRLVPACELADRLITNGEFQQFIADDGYRRPELWLSLGWSQAQTEGWRAPLYWLEADGGWRQFTLCGLQSLDPDEPVCNVSYYEADAYARWAGARLPREEEWERAALSLEEDAVGNFVESGALHPLPLEHEGRVDAPRQMYGDVWEWTSSAYDAYPGYQTPAGALGEYNGKFMCNQFVLRGGSCATSQSHIRPTYRNFFPPEARWQFSGIRLARDLPSDS